MHSHVLMTIGFGCVRSLRRWIKNNHLMADLIFIILFAGWLAVSGRRFVIMLILLFLMWKYLFYCWLALGAKALLIMLIRLKFISFCVHKIRLQRFFLPVRTLWWYVILTFPGTNRELLFVERVASEAESFGKKRIVTNFRFGIFRISHINYATCWLRNWSGKNNCVVPWRSAFFCWLSVERIQQRMDNMCRILLSSAAFSNFDHCQRNVKRPNAQPQVKLMPSTHWFLIEINSFNNNPIAHAANSISWPVGVRVIFMVELLHKRTNEETIFRLMIGKNHNFLFANDDNKSAQLNFLQFLHRRARL